MNNDKRKRFWVVFRIKNVMETIDFQRFDKKLYNAKFEFSFLTWALASTMMRDSIGKMSAIQARLSAKY